MLASSCCPQSQRTKRGAPWCATAMRSCPSPAHKHTLGCGECELVHWAAGNAQRRAALHVDPSINFLARRQYLKQSHSGGACYIIDEGCVVGRYCDSFWPSVRLRQNRTRQERSHTSAMSSSSVLLFQAILATGCLGETLESRGRPQARSGAATGNQAGSLSKRVPSTSSGCQVSGSQRFSARHTPTEDRTPSADCELGSSLVLFVSSELRKSRGG